VTEPGIAMTASTGSSREELRELRRVVARFVADRYPPEAVRAAMETDTGHDPDTWARMGAELGLPGLLVAEEHGGSGAGLSEVAVVAEEFGAATAPGPFLASAVLAASLVSSAGDAGQRADLLPGLADGSLIGTLALAERGSDWGLDDLTCTARPSATGGWRLTGRKEFVLDGHLADVLLVVAAVGTDVGIFRVDPAGAGVRVTLEPTMDQTRRLAEVVLDDAPGAALGPFGSARAALGRTLDTAMIALAAECVGGAQRCLDDAVAYAGTREQFGRVIGGFQAIKHLCADMLVAVEAARSAVRHAARVADAGADVGALARVALTAAAEAYSSAAAQNVQIHGGIGFTWEHGAHLHVKRAQLSGVLLGGDARRAEELAEHLARGVDTDEPEPFEELAGFRRELREWIAEHADPKLPLVTDWNAMPSGDGGQRAEHLADLAATDPLYHRWAEQLREARLICPHWPEEFGGRGWDSRRMAVFVEECHRAGVPRVHRGMAEAVVGPSIIEHGTPEQQARFLPRIISGEDVYCQGFSEPEQGSDLAGVRTRGVVDGDELVITGQKIWTTYAHRANMIFILCRTDPDAPKHQGLSYVLSEFAPGEHLTVRPVRQMTGAQDFSEEFIDGLRVPLANVIGGLGKGWAVAMTTLGGERSSRATGQQLARSRELRELVEAARANGALDDPALRRDLAWAYTRTELLRCCRLRILGPDPGACDATWKLQWSEYQQRFAEIALRVIGPRSAIRPPGAGYPTDRWQDTWLAARAATIYAGTSQIQRNILAERVLGLPR
jgi:alkylation response protein AidB-like acyl-CoA dehydrogenase